MKKIWLGIVITVMVVVVVGLVGCGQMGSGIAQVSAAAGGTTRGQGLTSFSRLPDTRVEADEIERILTSRMRFEVKAFKDETKIPGIKQGWLVGGTPVDCVKLAISRLIKEKIDA